MSFLLKPQKRNQALTSDFVPPPLDGSLTVPQIYDWHYRRNPHHPVFVYSSSTDGLRSLSFSDLVPAAHRAARYVAAAAGIDLTVDPSTLPVVAIFAATDSITFFTTILGMMRAGIPVFPISPRFSATVVRQILRHQRPHHVLISVEPALREVLRKAINELKQMDSYAPEVSSMPTFEELYTKHRNIPFEPLPHREYNLSLPSAIVHSSGSTSYPKPMIWPVRQNLQSAIWPWFGAHDFCGQIVGVNTLELFHGVGLFYISWVASTGMILATFEPKTPAITPTPEAVFRAYQVTAPAYVHAPPVLVTAWARDPAKVAYLSRLKGLMFGGKFLNKAVGDHLVKQGVHLHSVYGLTEAGLVSPLLPESPGVDWEYFPLNPHCETNFVPVGDGTYELVVTAAPTQELTKYNTKLHGKDAYASGDLLVPHPDRSGFWKLVGRKDDQIMLSTGEVINPCPLEDVICQHSRVENAVIFGRGRSLIGVIVDVEGRHDLDVQGLYELRQSLWSHVEEINAAGPDHTRILYEMIIIASPSKPFEFTGKGAPRRAAILQNYQPEIDALYSGAGRVSRPQGAPIVAL